MPNDAIHSDVSANPAGDDQPKIHPREAAMRNIMASRLQQFSTESGIEVKPTFEAAAVDPDADPDDAVAEAERARLAATDGKPTTDDDDQLELQTAPAASDVIKAKVKVKIDGEEREVTVEEMQREYQKGRTADRRLDEISRRARELDEREAQLALQQEQRANPTPAAAEKTELVDPTVAKQFTAALFDGDEEKAVAAFNAAVQTAVDKATQGRTQGATLDVDQITESVAQRFAIDSALKQSKSDYPDMYADPDIEALAAMKIRAKREEGLPFADALAETGREFAEKFGWKKSGRQEETASTTRNERLNRKESLDPVVGANVKSSSTEAPPLSNSQVIAQMAARRPGYGGG